MKVVINTDNKESVYELLFDERVIKNLIDEIIKNCSFRNKSRYIVEARTKNDAERLIENDIFWKEIKTYENISDIRAEEVNDPNDYWRPGDPRLYSFEAEAIIVPELVIYLMDILNGNDIDYEWFINRKELHKKDDMMNKIHALDLVINQTSNFNWETKIRMLNEFAVEFKRFKDIPNFDKELLTKYYLMVENSIKLDLVEETIKYKKRLK